MRALTDPWFSDFLLRIGDGVEDTVHRNFIRIPDDMVIPFTKKEKSLHALIDAIFPSFEINRSEPDYIISHAILSTRNDSVDEINDYLIGRFHGEEQIYYSFDEAVDDINNFYPVVFLNTLSVSGFPPHYLRLKVGCPIILLRNLDPSNGLCNGTRLICKSFQHNVIDVEIAVGQHAGKRGQTIPNVGIYLPESVFSHGQLYMALSKGISRATTKVLVKPDEQFNGTEVYTSNVVYKEVLHDK
ncbi:hypothetical protein Lser_V15G13505 [Lactuca serriola]